MEERIKTELRGRQPSEVQDLLLDNCKATSISGLTEEFSNLTTLSLINVGLTSLDGLPMLPTLRTIDLSDNKLSGGFDKLAECCPRLYHINLCANKIDNMETLAPLKNLEELAALDLFDCSVTEGPNYRNGVFELIPQLKYLDGFDVNDVEAEMSDEEGAEDMLSDEGDSAEEVNSDDEPELAYLNSTEALQDEDESEDYIDNDKPKPKDINAQEQPVTNGEKSVKNGEQPTGESARKRKANDEGAVAEGEPEAKQAH